MNMRKGGFSSLKISVLGLSLMLLAGTCFAANIYRYTDNNGKVIVGSQVPAEFVKNGYTIMNERGQILEEVPRTLSAEERAAQEQSLAQQQQSEQQRLQQQEEDTLLLRLYRTPAEVVRMRDSKVEELDAQISALTGLRDDAQEDIDRVQTLIDNNIAAGRAVPDNQTKGLADATEERDRLDRQIARINADREETIVSSERNIERLKVLLNLD